MLPKYVDKCKENRHICGERPWRLGFAADAPGEVRVGSIDGVEPSGPDAMADLVETCRGARRDAVVLRDNRRGMAAIEQRIAHERKCTRGDIVVVRSGALEARDKVIRFMHEMRNAETQEVAAVTMLTGVHFDTAARRSCVLPEAVIAKAGAAIIDDGLPW